MTTKTKHQNRVIHENPVEQQRGGFVDKVTNTLSDETKKDVNMLWKQLLGVTKDVSEAGMEPQVNEGSVKGSDLREGEWAFLYKREEKVERKAESRADIEPGIDYRGEILHAETKIRKEEERELTYQIEQIVVELKKLTNSSKELEVAFSDVTVQSLPETPGKYHINFFEWVLSAIQNARMKIEESAIWTNVITSKSAKRDYWNLAKKHGTSFSLSGERMVATQTG